MTRPLLTAQDELDHLRAVNAIRALALGSVDSRALDEWLGSRILGGQEHLQEAAVGGAEAGHQPGHLGHQRKIVGL